MSGPIVFTAIHGAYGVTTRSDATYFTVYCGDQIAGTILRPMRGDRHWSAYDTDGRFLGHGIGPRTALAHFTRRDREELRDSFATSEFGTED